MEEKFLKRKRKATGNTTQLILACTELAAFYFSEERYTQAIEEYETLAKIYKNESKFINYAQAHRGIGEAYMGLHKFEDGLKHFEIYHKTAVEENDDLEEQRALAQLGHMYLTWYLETVNNDSAVDQKRKLNKAYGYFMQSLKKCECLTINKLEKQDMLARLFSNLGLVKENLGEYSRALALFEKSIKICVDFDFYEQLYRGYMSLAALLEKQNQHNESIQNFNLAVETSKKLGSRKTELMCAALLGKSDVLIKLADFSGAKHVLHKAYKLKTPNKAERQTIEDNLRIVAAMCQIEDQLIVLSNDNLKLKSLYEKMGDACCLLKNYAKAIEYYKKMLEIAEQSGVNKKDLSVCYYSLAETYKDNGQYNEAVEYFEKEYLLCKDVLEDNLNTLSKIVDTKETAGAPLRDVKEVYERALNNCREKKNVKEEKRMIRRFKAYLKRINASHTETSELDQRLNELADENESFHCDSSPSSESEEEGQSEEIKVQFGEDIRLSDITDLSSDSEVENVSPNSNMAVGKRKRSKNMRFTRNEKGEWPLHRACIKNEIKVIQHLIDSGHPINVRDHCGWLPLHEAASHGHTEAARILLDHGATINDRGGAQCEGVTPLYDAAANGHLDLVQLLLDRGASPLVKSDKGDTALSILKDWYSANAPLSYEREILYKSLIDRFTNAFEKAGQKTEKPVNPVKIVKKTPDKENIHTNRNYKIGKLRRTIDTVDCEDDCFDGLSQNSAASDYQRTIDNLRIKKNSERNASPMFVTPEKKSALVHVEVRNDFVCDDDWLEDDLNIGTRKKKRRLDECSLSKTSSRSSLSRHSSASTEEISSPFVNRVPDSNTIEDLSSNDMLWDYSEPIHLSDSDFQNNVNPSRAKLTHTENISQKLKAPQSKLTQFGLTRTVVEADSTTVPYLSQWSSVEQQSSQVSNAPNDPLLFVDVEIEKKLHRVPILTSQLQNKNIKWLAEEAAARYASKQFMKPTLELETTNGAALADDDLVALLFPLAGTKAEQIVGRVVRWTAPPLEEKYRDTCLHMSTDPNLDLCQIADESSVVFDISDRGFLGKELAPFLKALSREDLLTEINLSGNFLSNDCVKILFDTITTLPNLSYLNISCTGLQTGHIMHFANIFQNKDNLIRKLNRLDFSDNSLKNKCLRDMSVITQNLILKELNLSNVGFTENIFDSQQDVRLYLPQLEAFDISYNFMKTEDIVRFLSWVDLTKITKLNVSKNKSKELAKELADLLKSAQDKTLPMTHLNLSRCDVEDLDAYDIMRLLPKLVSLDLSYNSNLTGLLKVPSELLKVNTLGTDIYKEM